MNDNQITTWKQAYEWSKLPEPKYICFGSIPLTKDGKTFFEPFLKAKLICKNTLKFTGVFRLTEKGIAHFEKSMK